jgi:hypothetical protein
MQKGMKDKYVSRRMPSCGMDLIRTDVSEEHIAIIIRVEIIRELGTT